MGMSWVAGGSSSYIGSLSQEDLSSLSSCHSNIDNIRSRFYPFQNIEYRYRYTVSIDSF
jgi:hypothetical protein